MVAAGGKSSQEKEQQRARCYAISPNWKTAFTEPHQPLPAALGLFTFLGTSFRRPIPQRHHEHFLYNANLMNRDNEQNHHVNYWNDRHNNDDDGPKECNQPGHMIASRIKVVATDRADNPLEAHEQCPKIRQWNTDEVISYGVPPYQITNQDNQDGFRPRPIEQHQR
jgi:hypothetical protein